VYLGSESRATTVLLCPSFPNYHATPLFGHEVEDCLACAGLTRGTASLKRYLMDGRLGHFYYSTWSS